MAFARTVPQRKIISVCASISVQKKVSLCENISVQKHACLKTSLFEEHACVCMCETARVSKKHHRAKVFVCKRSVSVCQSMFV